MVDEGSSAIDAVGAIGAADVGSSDSLPAATPWRQVQAQPTTKDLQDAVAKVNTRLSAVSRVLELTVDASTGLTVATVKDSQTGDVLQQFPGTDSLQLAAMLADWAGDKNALLDLIA
jgi:uncharacterized FlaG/YvyC family protein